MLLLVYSGLIWLLGRALNGVLRRLVPADAQPLARRTMRTVFRLTRLMLALESISALFPPLVLVNALSASSVDLIMRCWVSEADIATYPVISMQLSEQAKRALQDAGIEIPFPHLQLHIDGAKGL